MSSGIKDKPSPTSLFFLYGVSLFNVYLYTVLSIVVMQVWGLPYLALSETQLFKDALLMSVPLWPLTVYALTRMNFTEMDSLGARRAMLKFMVVLIVLVGSYSFGFLYLNINFAPSGHQLCSGEIVKKRRVKKKKAISHRIVIRCEVGEGRSFIVEKRVSPREYGYLTVGGLQPLTYVDGLLGVDLLVRHQDENE